MSDKNLHPVMQAALEPFMPRQLIPGELRVCDGAEYDEPGTFYVEYWGHVSDPGPRYGWVKGWAYRSGPHTEAQARWIVRTQNDASIRAAA